MQRAIFWLCIVVGAAIGGVVALALAAVVTFVVIDDWNIARPLVNQLLTTAVGRQVKISGDLDVDLARVSEIHMQNLLVANADWGKADTMLSVGNLDIALAVKPLLSGKIVLPSVTIADVRAALERRADGVGNWNVGESSERAEASAKNQSSEDQASQIPLIQHLDMRNTSVTLDDRRLNRRFDLELAQLQGGENREKQQLSFQGQGTYQGKPLDLQATLGSYAVLQQSEEPFPLDIRLSAGDFRGRVAGTLSDPRALGGLDLQLDIAGDDLANLLPLTGIPVPPSPPYRLIGDLQKKGSTWVFKDFMGLLGSSDMRGTVATDLGGTRPRIEGAVDSKLLDLKDLASFIGARGGGANPPPQPYERKGRVLPDKKVNLDQLRSVDAKISFAATRIITENLPIDRIDARISLDDGTLRVEPVTFALGEGDVRIDFALHGSRQPVRSDVNAVIRNIDVVRLLEKFGYTQDVAGTINGHIKLSASGTSVADIAGSSSGDLAIVMSDGRISELVGELIKLDIANALGVLIEGDKSIPVRCIVADFAADRGIFQARSLLFDTTNVEIIGSGHINMRDETLDLRLRPYTKDFSPFTLRTPISVEGTLASPDAFPDPADIGVETGIKKALNALLTVVTGLLPPVDVPSDRDAPCGALIKAAREHVKQ